ncbi:hypothetical protein O0L34_g16797 [Tuta absoluta]|nr:hypothetical protein O0L34_g16797 [Tuta absoluta]
MRLTLCVIFVIEIHYQQCFGAKFIELPGFGSHEKPFLEKNKDTEPNGRRFFFAPISQKGTKVNSTFITFSSQNFNTHKHLKNKLHSRRAKISKYLRPLFLEESKVNQTSSTENTPTKTDAIISVSPNSWPPERPQPHYRRQWLFRATSTPPPPDDKDENIKSKIKMLVDQTIHDSEDSMKTVQELKDLHRKEIPYRVGFILSMIKKSRDVLNELFNVAVKHRDEWKTLEQLKIFELIVHTNVDTNNLVRQLININMHSSPAPQQQDQQHQPEIPVNPENPQQQENPNEPLQPPQPPLPPLPPQPPPIPPGNLRFPYKPWG